MSIRGQDTNQLRPLRAGPVGTKLQYERSNRPTAANRPKVAQKNSLEISYLVGAT